MQSIFFEFLVDLMNLIKNWSRTFSDDLLQWIKDLKSLTFFACIEMISISKYLRRIVKSFEVNKSTLDGHPSNKQHGQLSIT